jgi:hypothetical protein
MKQSFASLVAVTLMLGMVLAGCGDSSSVSRPDTTPPLAPVVMGADGAGNTARIWWQGNTEPDLAGYTVYITMNGVTHRANQQPIRSTSLSVPADGVHQVTLYVTASDVSGNESSPSATKTVLIIQGEKNRTPIEGLSDKSPRF